MSRTLVGKEFHARGPATEKALSLRRINKFTGFISKLQLQTFLATFYILLLLYLQ